MGLGTFSGYYVINAWFLPFRVFDPRHGDVQTPGIVEDFSHLSYGSINLRNTKSCSVHAWGMQNLISEQGNSAFIV